MNTAFSIDYFFSKIFIISWLMIARENLCKKPLKIYCAKPSIYRILCPSNDVIIHDP